MAQITETAAGPNIPKFLDLTAFCEGTSTSRITRARGYDVIVTGLKTETDPGGPMVLKDFAHHPFGPGLMKSRLVGHFEGRAVTSSAAGRYQIEEHVWEVLAMRCKLPDFSPLSQDLAAIQLYREHVDKATGLTALDHIHGGDYERAVAMLAQTWASFPGSKAGQGGKTLGEVVAWWAGH